MILKKKYNKNRVSQLTNSFLTRFSFMIVIRCDNIKLKIKPKVAKLCILAQKNIQELLCYSGVDI